MAQSYVLWLDLSAFCPVINNKNVSLHKILTIHDIEYGTQASITANYQSDFRNRQ